MKRRSRAECVDLREMFCQTIASGLERKSIQSCSAWAEKYRYITSLETQQTALWSFKYVPWTKEMHDCRAPLVVGQKSAQAAFTETMLNVVFYNIDICGYDVLYVLPAKNPDASNFTAGRFNPALEESAHLRSIFSQVDNIGHKRAGKASLYIRGSRARTGLKSIPVNRLFLDEVEEMVQKNIPLAVERMSGKMDKGTWMVSTPSIDGRGINKYFQKTDQSRFHFVCPGCSRWTELVYPECLVIVGDDANDPKVNESYIRCKECGITLEHKDKPNFLAKNKWVPTFSGKEGRGFHINQLYSSTVTPGEFAKAAINARTNPADEQVLYNDKCGVTHSIAGFNVQEADIAECIRKYNYSTKDVTWSGKLRTMGIDVGSWNHWVVVEWDVPKRFVQPNDPGPECTPRIIAFGKCRHFIELDKIMKENNAVQAVIDARPEGRLSYEFAMRHWGHAHTCYYVRGAIGKQLSEKKTNDNEAITDEPAICVDRTSWLDATLSRFKRATIGLPREIDEEYKKHVMALKRVFEKDRNGELTSTYQTADDVADHYAHAQVYAEIALPFGLNMDIVRKRTRSIY